MLVVVSMYNECDEIVKLNSLEKYVIFEKDFYFIDLPSFDDWTEEEIEETNLLKFENRWYSLESFVKDLSMGDLLDHYQEIYSNIEFSEFDFFMLEDTIVNSPKDAFNHINRFLFVMGERYITDITNGLKEVLSESKSVLRF